MTPTEFAARAVGVPWVRWRSDWQSMDCFGLVVLWHREVLGVPMPDVPHTDIAAGFDAATGWTKIDAPEAGASAWMAWRNGCPTHCGMMLTASKVIHSEGSQDKPGSVRVSSLEAIRRVYGTIKFYRYTPC